MTPDEDLLMASDSLLSLIRHRESRGLSQQTIRDLDALLPRLRRRTDAAVADKPVPVNLAAVADACALWLRVWRDPFAEPSAFGPVTRRLLDTLPARDRADDGNQR